MAKTTPLLEPAESLQGTLIEWGRGKTFNQGHECYTWICFQSHLPGGIQGMVLSHLSSSVAKFSRTCALSRRTNGGADLDRFV
jgi:hypothetical protein